MIELPVKRWPDLLSALLANVTGAGVDDNVKRATLDCLGYLCEELEEGVVEEAESNQILTAIVDGMRAERDPKIRLSAVKALLNCLEFIKHNMGREQERNMIMQVICEATRCPDANVRKISFEILAQIATLYYDKLQQYMQVLFNLTFECVQKDEEDVALQGLEFWSTLAEEECERIENAEEAADEGREIPQDERSVNYVRGALAHLIPLLTEAMAKQEDEQDEDAWNLSTSGGTCLNIVARTVRDEVVDPTMPFITAHIQDADWHKREAAIMAFGSIMEGPSEDKLKPLVVQALPMLLTTMNSDPNVLVKDTCAWSVGQICDYHASSIPPEMLTPLLQALMAGLDLQPRVSANVCYAIHNLAQSFESEGGPTNPLSQFFSPVAEKLLQITERPDASECNLRMAAYECVNMMIQNAAEDVKPVILQLVPVIIERLERTFTKNPTSLDDKDEVYGAQSLLCGVLQVSVQMLEGGIRPHADRLMQALLQVFSKPSAVAHEESFMAVGAVANAVEKDFERYMQSFHPFLMEGLRNQEEYNVCAVAVGVVGDACRSLEVKLTPFCDEIVTLLLQNLQNPHLNRCVKPPVLSCFGDIALAISGGFAKYLQVVMTMLQQAAGTEIQTDDEELLDYMMDLRYGILEAYTGIIQGLKEDNKGELMLPFVPAMMEFIARIVADENRYENVTRACAGVIGDLAHTLSSKVGSFMSQAFVHKLLLDCQQPHRTEQTQEVGKWAQDILQGMPKSIA
jgi:importin subunit beta-1